MLSQEALLYMFMVMWGVSIMAFMLHYAYIKKFSVVVLPFLFLAVLHPALYMPISEEVSITVSLSGILIFSFFLVKVLPLAIFQMVKVGGNLSAMHMEKYRALSELGSDILLVVHKKGHITYVNESMRTLVGHAPKTIYEKGLKCICKGAQLVVLEEGMELSKKNKGHPSFIPQIVLKDKQGQELYFESKVTYLPTTPNIEGWVISLRNIQRRREIQQNLTRLMRLNSLLLRSSQLFMLSNPQSMNTKIQETLQNLVEETGFMGCTLWQNLDAHIKERFDDSKKGCMPKTWRSFAGLKRQEWLMAQLEGKDEIVITDIDALPESAESEKKAFQSKKIETCLLFPLRHVKGTNKKSEVQGVLALSAPADMVIDDALVAQISLFAKMLLAVIQRQFVEDQLRILSQAVQQSPSSVLIIDPEGRVEFINHRFEEVTGYSASEVLGKDSAMFNAEQNDPDILNKIWQTVMAGKMWKGELLNRKKNGEMFWEHISVTPIRGPNGAIRHFLSSREDISLRKEYEEALEQKSHYDVLTGLPNRTLVQDRLAEIISRREDKETLVAAMVVGLDNFKKVNDTFGHQEGDRLLLNAIERIKDAVSKIDYTIGRLGGDEFLVILDNCTKEQSELAASHINRAFKTPFILESQAVSVTATVGVSLCPADGDSARTLLQNADVAMHRAKEDGRDTFHFYTEEIHEDAMARVRMESLLRRAIETDQLELHFQPIIDAEQGTVSGAEALIRWQSPELGFVSPLDFIPLAEDVGLIIPIGEWVLETACKQVKLWEGLENGPRYVTVNVSARQFENGDFVSIVKKVLKRTKVKAKSIHLEVTESLLIDDRIHVEDDLKALSKMGVRISLDDFGTGYSSLSYLKRYHFDTLKVDRSFVRDLPDDLEDKALVEAILVMAHSLKMDVVAEGVETEAQKDYLKGLNCDRLQGYFFSKPLKSCDFDDFVSNWLSK